MKNKLSKKGLFLGLILLLICISSIAFVFYTYNFNNKTDINHIEID